MCTWIVCLCVFVDICFSVCVQSIILWLPLDTPFSVDMLNLEKLSNKLLGY